MRYWDDSKAALQLLESPPVSCSPLPYVEPSGKTSAFTRAPPPSQGLNANFFFNLPVSWICLKLYPASQRTISAMITASSAETGPNVRPTCLPSTKSFLVAEILLMLIEKAARDESVETQLPQFSKHGLKITLRQPWLSSPNGFRLIYVFKFSPFLVLSRTLVQTTW